jgi:hypothetical protein
VLCIPYPTGCLQRQDLMLSQQQRWGNPIYNPVKIWKCIVKCCKICICWEKSFVIQLLLLKSQHAIGCKVAFIAWKVVTIWCIKMSENDQFNSCCTSRCYMCKDAAREVFFDTKYSSIMLHLVILSFFWDILYHCS